MKIIEYKKIDTGKELPELNIPSDQILNWFGTLEDLKSNVSEIMKILKPDYFDYREILKNHIKSQKWAQKHLLVSGEDIQLAMAVHEALSASDKVEVDEKVADYICDVAESMEWTTGLALESLPHAAEFKEYFKKLKESKGTNVKDKD